MLIPATEPRRLLRLLAGRRLDLRDTLVRFFRVLLRPMVGEAAFEVDRGRAFAWSVSMVGGLVAVVGESGMMSGLDLVEREAVHRVRCTNNRSRGYSSISKPLVCRYLTVL